MGEENDNEERARANPVCACLTFMMGCASIVSDSQYPVTFDSKPAGAEIEISNRHGEVVPDRFEVEMPVTSAGAAEPQLRIIDISEIDAAQRGTLIAVH